ncbi:MAG: hypothetical protein Q4A86_02940 [Clostridia bacterium]|nr:hypothetical protein [Clostridia bacterium]
MEEKDIKKNNEKGSKELTDAGKIKGKIDIHDTRERKDGPGGN